MSVAPDDTSGGHGVRRTRHIPRSAACHHESVDTRLPQADPVCDAATARHTAVHVRTPAPAGGPGVGGSGLRRCAILAARCRDPCLTTVCDPTPHLGANGIMKEVIAMPSEASPAPESLQTPRPRAALADDHASAVLERYLRDVRRFPVLSHARERALSQNLQESRQQWRHLLLEHLVHVPLVLAWGPRLHRVAGQMRRVVQQQDPPPQTVLALRASMRALLQDWEWQLVFLQQAWRRFDRAMMLATTTRQSRRALTYVATLGYSLAELGALWRDLSDVDSLAEQAKQAMVLHNLRLVLKVAGTLRAPGVPLSDLIQDDNPGLLRAVDGFDYRRNCKFSTYAVWWIRQAIHRGRAAQALVRVPEYLHADAQRVHRTYDAFITTHGHAPTAQDLAQRLGLPLARVQWSLDHPPEPLSLDSPVPGQGRTLQQVLPRYAHARERGGADPAHAASPHPARPGVLNITGDDHHLPVLWPG
jgi:DNA-directed RNA polymerase sigma subunit (sigma70/sigma32)